MTVSTLLDRSENKIVAYEKLYRASDARNRAFNSRLPNLLQYVKSLISVSVENVTLPAVGVAVLASLARWL